MLKFFSKTLKPEYVKSSLKIRKWTLTENSQQENMYPKILLSSQKEEIKYPSSHLYQASSLIFLYSINKYKPFPTSDMTAVITYRILQMPLH